MVEKIISFIEGNLKLAGDKINVISTTQKEQVLYRMEVCKDTCMKKGKCENCGCSVPGRLYSTLTCDIKKFPNLMKKEDWNKYKKSNNIIVK